ncbi:MAG: heme-binding protein [Deltaproteobacteria bacterium]|nr:MAG: heme-binding protein [Deltaproteobacteria bacterium]
MRAMLVAAALAAVVVGPARAQVVEKKVLTLEGARRAIAAAEAEARRDKAGGIIAVVDDGGNLIALERLEGTFAAGARISIGKARTAALFKKPTRFFEELINKSRTAMAALDDFTPLIGGVPIVIDGQIVGAIGVSGANSAQQDEERPSPTCGARKSRKPSSRAGRWSRLRTTRCTPATATAPARPRCTCATRTSFTCCMARRRW